MRRALLARLAQGATTVSTVLLALGIGAAAPAAAAGKNTRSQLSELEQSTMTGSPVMAIVSVKDQRISLYDANGGFVRSKVSSGQSGYETPVGVFSILQKNKEHYSNIYDAASMPFMQRITWSGLALHQGELPGYPASHGCVRLPQNYAEHIFGRTRLGMRVVISRNDIAPAEITHPNLLQPDVISSANSNKVYETKIAYNPSEFEDQRPDVFQADVRETPSRQAEMDALKADSDAKTAAAELTKEPVDSLTAQIAAKTKERVAAEKASKSATRAYVDANDKAARANRALAAAKDPAKITKAERELADAEAALANATASLAAARAAVTAQTSDRERRNAERLERAADRTKDKATSRASAAARALAYFKEPARYKKEEELAAKAQVALSAAKAGKAKAEAALNDVKTILAQLNGDLNAATVRRTAALADAKEALRKTYPVSLLISRKTQRVYLRQGHEPVMDMPIAIADPERSIGTYVFTAVDYKKDGAALTWTAVSLGRHQGTEDTANDDRAKRRDDVPQASPPTNVTLASAALDRVALPPEMLRQVSQSVWPGSSIIVTDEEPYKETGTATDFIVVMSGEPQGGLKKRPKPKPQNNYYLSGGSYYYSSPYSYSYSGSGYGYGYAYGSPKYGVRPARPLRIQPAPKPKFGWW